MKVNWRLFVITIFLIGFLVVGLTGASTSMSFVWPGYFTIGLAGVLSIISLFRTTYFRVPLWCFGSVFVLLAYMLARASDSPVLYFSREDSSLLVVCFLCYGVFISFFTELNWRKLVFGSVIVLVALNLAFALWQWFVWPGQWIFPGYERTFQNRVGGVFNHPDHFACFLAASIPLLLSLACFGKYPKPFRIGFVLLAAGSVLGIIAAKSLIGFIAMSMGAGVFMLLSFIIVWKNLNPQVKKVAVTAGVLSCLVVGGFLIANKARVAHAVDSRLLTKEGVIHLPMVWEAAKKQFSISPFIGTGSRSFYFYSRRYLPSEAGGDSVEAEFVHNEFIQMLADYGLIGFGAIMLVLVLHFGSGLKFIRAYIGFRPLKGPPIPQSDHLALVLGSIGGLTVIGTQSLFDFVMHVPAIAIFASLMLATMACPDPMSSANESPRESYLPGGNFLFITRAVSFGSGFALLMLGIVFTRSEWHFEQGRLAFQSDSQNFQIFRHLQTARRLDPGNPFIYSLSAHSHVATIETNMAEPARVAALKKADDYFSTARQLYPHDIFAAIGHSSVLDELGQHDRSRELLRDAREWAPAYGCLMMAEAEHFLRQGDVEKAEESYLAARNAGAFRNETAADRGLEMISNWRKIALVKEKSNSSDKTPRSIEIKDAAVEEKLLSGKSKK